MLLAPLVVVGRRVLDGLQHLVVGDHPAAIGVGGEAVDHQFQGVQQPSCVASAGPQKGLCFLQRHGLGRHVFVLNQGPGHQALKHFCRERLEHVRLATAAQGRNDLERRVLSGGAQQRDCSRLHRTEQAVLLGLREPVDLVDEQQRPSREHAVTLHRIQHVAHVLDPTVNRAQAVERPSRLLGNQPCQGGFAHARRSPQNHAGQRPCPHGLTQHGPFPHQVGLSDVTVKGGGPHPLGQRRVSLHGVHLLQVWGSGR